MNHLIIKGKPGTGKTLLGEWIDDRFSNARVFDGLTKDEIKDHSKRTLRRGNVYITNEDVTYNDFSSDNFLIITLCN